MHEPERELDIRLAFNMFGGHWIEVFKASCGQGTSGGRYRSNSLKKMYGSELCFSRGVDIQKVLISDSPKDVQNHEKDRIKDAAIDGRLNL